MIKFICPMLTSVFLFSACSGLYNSPQSQAVVSQTSPSRSIITSSSTSTPLTSATTTLSLTYDSTITTNPTLPPAGIFAIKFYPPLVLDYPTVRWVDKSEYENTQMMVNVLQNLELRTCSLEPMGPSGFYPDNMVDKMLGNINYQVLMDQKTDTGNLINYYFAISTSTGSIENETGTPHFFVQSSPVENAKCRAAAEEVLATLRRADQP